MANTFRYIGPTDDNDDQVPEQTEQASEYTDNLIALLKTAVTDELLAAYNYMASYTLSKTAGKVDFDPEFEQHEKEELDHAHSLLMRLRELDADGMLKMEWKDFPVQNSMGSNWRQETR